VAVIYRGQILGEFDISEVTEEKLGILMAGGSLDDPDSGTYQRVTAPVDQLPDIG